jgi:hypothetical protein
MLACLRAEIWILDLPNKKQDHDILLQSSYKYLK